MEKGLKRYVASRLFHSTTPVKEVMAELCWFQSEYSTALKRVGIESGLCIVLYLQGTNFPLPQEVNMRGRHAAVMIQMSQ
jgi:hypothetical protein